MEIKVQIPKDKYVTKKLEEIQSYYSTFILVGPFLHVAFWFADIVKFPEHKYEFLMIRLFFALMTFAIYLYLQYSKRVSFFKIQLSLTVTAAYAAGCIVYMMAVTEGPASIYFCGINLVALFVLPLSLFNNLFFYTNVATIYVPYITLCIFQFDSFGNWSNFFIYNIFNVGTIIGSLMARTIRENDFNRMLQAEYSLENEIRLREKIIVEKTAEATALKYNEALVAISRQVAHDIRSPLSVMNLLMPSMLSNPCGEKKQAVLDAVNRANRIAQDLLDVGRVQKTNYLTTNDLSKVVDEIILEKKSQFGVEIFKIENHKILVAVIPSDSITLSRVISNLINNSIEACADLNRVEISITLENKNNLFIIKISDNGKGISNEHISDVGKCGFSFGKENIKDAGTGLGVYFSKKTINDLGGEFIIDSEVGKGTIVTMLIPISGGG